MNAFICLYLLISSISVNICQYLSICIYLFICLYLYVTAYICQYVYICLYVCICAHHSDLAVKAATVSNSQQQYTNSLTVTAVTAACLYRSIRSYLCISVCIRPLSVHICIYLFIFAYICSYLHISVHICAYMFISKNFFLRGKNLIFRKKDFWF